jgi:hypothetical protein
MYQTSRKSLKFKGGSVMKYIKEFLSFFTTITTAILIIVTANAAFGTYDSFPKYLPIEILISSAVTALISTLIFNSEIKTKKLFILMTAVHYVLLCIIMSMLGIMFEWIPKSIVGIMYMVIDVAIVYTIVVTVNYILAKKEATELNHALEKRNHKE